MAEAVIVIPARHASTRFPGKPLVPLRGARGTTKTLLARCIEAARATGLPCYVATDDDRIAAEAARHDCPAILTDTSCANGTERVAQAIARAGILADIVVNLQGDAPLTPPKFVTALVSALRSDPLCQIATPVLRCDAQSFDNFTADRRAGRVGATTAVRDAQGRALYFSKEMLPFTGGQFRADVPVYHHVGLYAYRASALAQYANLPQGPLERSEGLEQLRFLENGIALQTVEVKGRGFSFWEVNNPADIALVEAGLQARGLD
jgi:3-deoxy-manno-octulosonate cytidylyltransferase (CMP-KDO synthetase)